MRPAPPAPSRCGRTAGPAPGRRLAPRRRVPRQTHGPRRRVGCPTSSTAADDPASAPRAYDATTRVDRASGRSIIRSGEGLDERRARPAARPSRGRLRHRTGRRAPRGGEREARGGRCKRARVGRHASISARAGSEGASAGAADAAAARARQKKLRPCAGGARRAVSSQPTSSKVGARVIAAWRRRAPGRPRRWAPATASYQ